MLVTSDSCYTSMLLESLTIPLIVLNAFSLFRYDEDLVVPIIENTPQEKDLEVCSYFVFCCRSPSCLPSFPLFSPHNMMFRLGPRRLKKKKCPSCYFDITHGGSLILYLRMIKFMWCLPHVGHCGGALVRVLDSWS